MTKKIIQTEGLTVYYGKHRGIIDVDLNVQEGEIFGFLGPNGAGKTTTQRVLLDVIRPNRGKASMFGFDCQKEGVKARQHVSYLPGELSLYGNMKAFEFFEMINSIRGHNGDRQYRESLCDRLDLDPSRKIRNYSRGNKQKVGIVMAFMHKPDLLILDEPTTGLDPLVQQTVLDMVREAKAAGSTVFFSSHILSEVQAVCDRVGIIRDGRLVKTESVYDLVKQNFKRMKIKFNTLPEPELDWFDGVKETGRKKQRISFEVSANLDDFMKKAADYGIIDIETTPVSLEEVFLTYYGKGNGENHV